MSNQSNKFAVKAARFMVAVAAILSTQNICAPPAAAHEFWLAPSNYTPKKGAKVAITTRNGMFFKGNSFPYIKAWFHEFQIADARGVRPIKGLDGDDPAAQLTLDRAGLAIISYHGTPDLLTFKKWEKFKSYLKDEGLQHLLARHKARGLSEQLIKESYSRCAKALIAVGGGKGEDRALGLPLELVAEHNPYVLPPGAPLPVRLLLKGRPIAGITIKVFNKNDAKQPQRYITQSDGRAVIPLPHKGAYLLNAVHMFDPPAGAKTQWHSLWASMTFLRR